MKATRAHLLGEFTGKLDGLIYYRRRNSGKLYVRRQFHFINHPCHAGFGSVQKAIYGIQPSEGYKQDLRDYLYAYNKLPESKLKRYETWTNIYAKLMYAMQSAMPETVDLQNISREQVIQQNLPCITVQQAVDAGILPQVKDYQRLCQRI